jgi:hypothetical protein
MVTRREGLLAESARRNALAHQVLLAAASNASAAKAASQMNASKLAQAITELMKRGIKPSQAVAEAAISTLSQSKNSPLIQKVLDILSQQVHLPGITTDPNSIGNAYFAGRKAGSVYGSPTIPYFKLKLNGSNKTEWKGWKLVPRPSVGSRMRFDFVKEKSNEGKSIENIARNLDSNLSDSILAILKGKVAPQTVAKVIEKTPQSNLANTIFSLVKASASGVRKNTLHTAATTSTGAGLRQALATVVAASEAGQTPENIHTVVKSASTKNLTNKLTALVKNGTKGTPSIAASQGRTGFGGFLAKFFKGRPRFPTMGGFALNPLTLIPQFIDGIPVQWSAIKGYFIQVGGRIIRVFQKGNKLVSQEGKEAHDAPISGTSKNRIAELVASVKALAERLIEWENAYLKAYREARDASNANKASKTEAARKARLAVIAAAKEEAEALAELKALYRQLLGNGNKGSSFNVESYLYSSAFSGMSATARSKKLAELYKNSKPGTREREIIKTRILEEIRNAGQNADAGVAVRRLQNLRTNLGSSLNRNLSRAFGIEKSRARENLAEYSRRNENRRRGYNEGPRRSYGNEGPHRSYGNEGRRRSYGNEGPRHRNEGPANEGIRRHYTENAASLPMNQKNAITNAGGITTALNTVASVPGGATEVANVAKALNASPGNTSGLNPVAVRAVQKLGGSKKTIVILQGLNTLSRKTMKRKVTHRPMKIRVAELNRVINAVKKKKLISLMAHNVTKTHNIHPNDEKKKKYYKKVLKSNILRTKFAKIVKKAVKKNK